MREVMKEITGIILGVAGLGAFIWIAYDEIKTWKGRRRD